MSASNTWSQFMFWLFHFQSIFLLMTWKKKVESGSGVWASATHVDLAEAFGSQLQPDPVLARTAWKGRSKWKILLSITLPFKANK